MQSSLPAFVIIAAVSAVIVLAAIEVAFNALSNMAQPVANSFLSGWFFQIKIVAHMIVHAADV